MPICGTCSEDKPLEDFSLKFGRPQYNCKSCHSEYRKEHYRKNRQKYIDKAQKNKIEYRHQYYEWLSDKSCVDCGETDIRVLEQDHLGNKEFNIASKVGVVKLSTLMNELEKCEVVCANCHRIRTAERAGWTKNNYANIV